MTRPRLSRERYRRAVQDYQAQRLDFEMGLRQMESHGRVGEELLR